MRGLCFLFFSLIIFISKPLQAQESHVALSEYFVESWSTKDGLPHNSINAIAQTEEGYRSEERRVGERV